MAGGAALLTTRAGQPGGRSFGANLGLWPEIRDQAVAVVLNWCVPLRLVEGIIARPYLVVLLVGLAGLGVVALTTLLLRQSMRMAVVSDLMLSVPVHLLLSLVAFLGVVLAAALFPRRLRT